MNNPDKNRIITNVLYQQTYPRFAWGERYDLSGEAFTSSIIVNIAQETGLQKSEWLGDWWTHQQDNPVLSWRELVGLALHILHTDATNLFVHNLHVEVIPVYPCANGPLVTNSVRGAKRINAHREPDGRFYLYGKEEGCQVEGTWFDWCCFACNVLASKNTEALCPQLYEPALANENY